MKKILYLFLAVTMFACSGGDSGDANDDNNFNFDCADFDSSTAPSLARQKAINYDSNYFNLFVSEFGQPIDDGFFKYDDGYEDSEDYYYIFLFADGDGNRYAYIVGNYCVTYGTTDYPNFTCNGAGAIEECVDPEDGFDDWNNYTRI
jgi:hypothetical protein